MERNEANKLTSDQKEDKMKRKHKRDLENGGCKVALFKVANLTKGAHKFKVKMNAEQLHLTGYALIADSKAGISSLVLVEGGPRSILKYKRLLLRRIQWDDSVASKAEEETEEQMEQIKQSMDRKCFLVWEGELKKQQFDKFRLQELRNENEGRRILSEKGCEHYWNMVMTFNPLRGEGEDPDALEEVLK